MLVLLSLLSPSFAEAPSAPRRQVPPSVLSAVQQLEARFAMALAEDCDGDRCFSKGCTYITHSVADRPRSTSLPGLGMEPGPGSVEPQAYLTQAQCAYTYEESVESADVQALTRRLQLKMSKGWTVVSVTAQALQPLSDYVGQPPGTEVEPEPEPQLAPPEPEELTLPMAVRELWAELLPHFAWMIAVLLGTLAATTLIWAWRRVGQASLEEQALLAQLTQPAPGPPDDVAMVTDIGEDEQDFVQAQHAAWAARVSDEDAQAELRALAEELLRSGDMPLLAKAVLTFPRHFPAAFPSGAGLAEAKLQLAEYLKSAEEEALPSDAVFFAALNRHALAATLSAQDDAQLVRSLREDFGTAGLVSLIVALPARIGALLFALAPPAEHHEMVRLLSSGQAADLAGQLLRSNRLDPSESTTLLDILKAARSNQPLPAVQGGTISDRGVAFDAAGALSVLLPQVLAADRAALIQRALSAFGGTLPTWYRGILFADMLLLLPAESRADLMLAVEAEPLAAWMALQRPDARQAILSSAPNALRAALGASGGAASPSLRATMAGRARLALARGLQRQLAREGISLAQALQPQGGGGA